MRAFEEKKRKRLMYLRQLYEMTEGNINLYPMVTEVGQEAGLSAADAYAIVDYLEGEGVVHTEALGVRVALTHRGLKQIEAILEREADLPAPIERGGNAIHVYGDLVGSPIQQGAVQSTQTVYGANVPRREDQRSAPSQSGARQANLQQIHPPVELFYSYSHRDERLLNKLSTHLAALQREGVISAWHDRKITAGQEWKGAIDQYLASAAVILLLISADFLASDYCYDKEMTWAMERHDAGEARVIPVILRECDWANSPFAKLQALPSDAKPITSWRNRDAAFKNVAEGVRHAVQELAAASTKESQKVWAAKSGRQANEGNQRNLVQDSKIPATDFVPIEIIDLNADRMHKDPNGALVAYIEVSAEPPADWVRLLRAECRMPRGTMRRPLRGVEGKFLVLEDAYGGNSLGAYMDGLRQDVARANATYQEYLNAQASRETHQSERQQQEIQYISDLKHELGF